MNVRAYRPEDRSAVRYICHATARGKRYRSSMKLVCSLYCDYYIERESEHCFVLTDEFDKAVGYILCSADDDKFGREFEPYLKAARKLSFSDALGHKLERALTRRERYDYPAHLHIDILQSFQGRGGGRALIKALKEHLKSIGVKGLRLGVGLSNKGAIAFYERLGFNRVKKLVGSCVYAIKLS